MYHHWLRKLFQITTFCTDYTVFLNSVQIEGGPNHCFYEKYPSFKHINWQWKVIFLFLFFLNAAEMRHSRRKLNSVLNSILKYTSNCTGSWTRSLWSFQSNCIFGKVRFNITLAYKGFKHIWSCLLEHRSCLLLWNIHHHWNLDASLEFLGAKIKKIK